MKEILDEESKNALINYRIQRAYETLKEAQVMMRESFYNAAVNRLYYAMLLRSGFPAIKI